MANEEREPKLGTYSLRESIPVDEVFVRRAASNSGVAPRPADGSGNSSHTARRPSRLPSRAALESVSDAARRMTQEVARALPGQELDYVEPFRELGIVGLDALVAAFPGPTRGNVFDLARPPRGRDISAIARVLHELGPKAFAHLRQLLAHASSDTRYLALLLVVDADHAELADAIAGRLFDADYAVAKLAERAVEAAKDSERRDALGAQLSAFVRSRSIDAARRLRAVELIGQLRLERGLSALIESLDDPHPKISASAHAGLVQLTAHDCGSSSRDWMRFLRDHRTSARTSWLLLALSGKSTEHRDVAAQELARVTGETFGYVPGCGEARVEAVRSAYARLLRGR